MAHPIIVEQEKPAVEMGTYLHPELYYQPVSQGMNLIGVIAPAAMHPAAMKAVGNSI